MDITTLVGENQMSEDLKTLGTELGRESHHIIESQGATAQFGHVSQIWEKQCLTYEQGKVKLAAQQDQIEDFETPLSAWEVTVDGNDCVFKHRESGRNYRPTDHALGLMCQVGRGMSDFAVRALRDPICHATKIDKATGEKLVLFKRDATDAGVMRDYLKLHLFNSERVDQNKTRLFRTWKDGTLRAFLSSQYAIVNNGWYLDLLSKLIPGGLLSHWKGDADTIYGNILIPDTIRKEKDSDYGGMLGIGNSEIGLRQITSSPSVFRAICMNGCIWEQEKGVTLNRRHRGAIDFTSLAAAIKENLEKQIPLLPLGIERMLGLRAFGVGDTPLENIFAQLSADYTIGKKEIKGVWGAYAKEVSDLGTEDGRTAFGILNAVTRFGQTLENDRWVTFDQIGGALANMKRNDWDMFRNRASNMTAKQVEKRLEVAA